MIKLGAKSNEGRSRIATVSLRSEVHGAAVNIKRTARARVRVPSAGSQLSSRSIMKGESTSDS